MTWEGVLQSSVSNVTRWITAVGSLVMRALFATSTRCHRSNFYAALRTQLSNNKVADRKNKDKRRSSRSPPAKESLPHRIQAALELPLQVGILHPTRYLLRTRVFVPPIVAFRDRNLLSCLLPLPVVLHVLRCPY